MKRREFLGIVGGALAPWPVVARAQRSSMPVIGFLHVASAQPLAQNVARLRDGLKEVGYTEGQNVAIEFRWAEGRYDRLPELAADLIRHQVAVIITGGGEAPALAVKAATSTIPIVFNIGSDPVKLGLVASLNRPGGNATGVNIFTNELAAKRLGLLHELTPTGSIIAHLVNPNFPATEANVKEVEAAALLIGRQIPLLKASSESEIDTAFATMSQMRIGALLVGADPFFLSRREQIVALAARQAMPAIYEFREFVLAGGLIGYGTNLADSYRQMGVQTGKILRGEKAGEMPVVQSTKFQLVVNLKTAKVLGLTLPSGLLSITDEVIE